MAPTIEQKLESLGISPTLSKARIRSELKAILKRVHPDATGGSFQSKTHEMEYQAALEALSLLDDSALGGNELQVLAANQTALAETQASLIKMIDEQRQLAKAEERAKAAETSVSKAEAIIARTVRQRYLPFIVGGWGVAAFAAAIGLLDKPLADLSKSFFQETLLLRITLS